ncbi:MAG: DUF4272 domain-containing protein [Lachnospiraceae bacterium]|nr:DUF4272 domain-containing protein [Lachnospiraceae bacterium]
MRKKAQLKAFSKSLSGSEFSGNRELDSWYDAFELRKEFMKTRNEIYARTVILQCLTDRCCLDMDWEEDTLELEEREEQRQLIFNWLNNKGYVQYTTAQERELFCLPIGKKSFKKNELIEIDVQSKAMDVLLWVLCKTNDILPLEEVAISDNHSILNISKDHNFDKEVSKCELKPQSEIAIQADIAFLWNWRMNEIELRATKGANHNISELIIHEFGDRYKNALEHIEIYTSKNPRSSDDFVIFNLVVRELYKWQKDLLKYSTYWRYHAFRWILDDAEWDKI